MSNYIIISRNEDGEVSVYTESDKSLLKKLNNEEYDSADILNEIPEDNDPQYWPQHNPMIIIKGKICVPKPKNVVKEYEL